MFDMVTGEARHIPVHNAVPLLISSVAEAVAITMVIAVPLLFVTTHVPEIPSMMAFVVAAPPPPPPPPPAPRAPEAAKPQAVQASPSAAPVEAPSQIKPEPATPPSIDEGVPGGVEGGIPGGVVGGVLGGMFTEAPPPPPPPAPVQHAPVRIAGEMKAPALLKRVEPEYPRLAVAAHVTGVVILEATVDEQGRVQDVRVLRSVHPLLDQEAMVAVRQWRYSPLTLNGHLSPFILTVTLSFHLEAAK